VVFDEPEFSEHHYARQIADQYRTIHTEIALSESGLLAMLPDALSAMDQPTMDGVNTYVVARAVHEAGVKVALSGLGGDELFAGYPSFRRAVRIAQMARIPRSFRRAAAAMAKSTLGDSVAGRKARRYVAEAHTTWDAYLITRELFAPDEVSALLGHPAPASDCPRAESEDPVNEISRYEMEGYMTSTLLRDTDQMSMAHALEVRVPFIDPKVASLVLSLPGSWKLDRSRPKPLLLDALHGLLPREITHRKKMGFTLPFERWMRSSLKQEIDRVFAAHPPGRLGLPGYAAEIWRTFCGQPRREKWARPWALYVLLKWCERSKVSL
ncbi:MAG TPA: asparagine synthase C-terminal domain-containing protein, partial [Burkholderiales bacterium]|nr:asparagine synthase C-terminal domain-containing protein [Burkholderiales bacterium]